MLCSIDLCSLFNRTVVQPEHNVPIIVEFGTGHGDGLIGVVGEDSQGAGSVECQTSDSGRVDVVLVEDPLDRGADTTPDVICRLLLKVDESLAPSDGMDMQGRLYVVTLFRLP